MPKEKTLESKPLATSVAAHRATALPPKLKVTASPANAPAAKAKKKPMLGAKARTPVAQTAPAARVTAKPAKTKRVEVATDGLSILNLNNAVNGSVTAGQIAERAYFHWQERGCPFGSPEEDWFRAEQELELLR
jgi:hypothetical protein